MAHFTPEEEYVKAAHDTDIAKDFDSQVFKFFARAIAMNNYLVQPTKVEEMSHLNYTD